MIASHEAHGKSPHAHCCSSSTTSTVWTSESQNRLSCFAFWSSRWIPDTQSSLICLYVKFALLWYHCSCHMLTHVEKIVQKTVQNTTFIVRWSQSSLSSKSNTGPIIAGNAGDYAWTGDDGRGGACRLMLFLSYFKSGGSCCSYWIRCEAL